jgi:hypothetical protein
MSRRLVSPACHVGLPSRFVFAGQNVAEQDESPKNTTFNAQVQQLSLLPLTLFLSNTHKSLSR